MQDNAIDMAKRLLIDSIWKSANLEGLGTTFPKTEAIILNAPTETTAEEVMFIVNMKHAWQFLFDNIDYENNLTLLRELNKIVGENLFRNNGVIRTIPVQIGGTTWVPEMPDYATIMSNLQELNSIANIEIKALKFFCFVARTQIFIDGNKRVAQLIANKILIQNNIGIFQIDLKDLEEFKTQLIKFYETNKDDIFINFMQKQCIKHVAISETNFFN